MGGCDLGEGDAGARHGILRLDLRYVCAVAEKSQTLCQINNTAVVRQKRLQPLRHNPTTCSMHKPKKRHSCLAMGHLQLQHQPNLSALRERAASFDPLNNPSTHLSGEGGKPERPAVFPLPAQRLPSDKNMVSWSLRSMPPAYSGPYDTKESSGSKVRACIKAAEVWE